MEDVTRNVVNSAVYPAANRVWSSVNIANEWYGVEIDTAASSPTLTRIAGNTALHVSLPVQSLMKGCVLRANGTVAYYLNASNWAYKANGLASNLTGADGFVMVEFPTFYYQLLSNHPSSGKHQIRISLYPIPGYIKVQKHYVSAYHATVDNVNTRMASVVSTATQYRGGHPTNGTDQNMDATYATMLGKPSSYFTRAWARPYARAIGSGWNLFSATDQNWINWMFAIEYATLNCQATIDATLTAEGYRQGGLGVGVTTTDNGTWNNYFNSAGYGYTRRPLINCGVSNSLGNGTGAVSHTPTSWIGGAFAVNRYRGIETPFGSLWSVADGIIIALQSAGAGGASQVWISDTPSAWNDTDYSTYTNIGNNPRANGYQSAAILGTKASCIATTASGAATTYYCDYFYTLSIPGSGTTLSAYCFGASAHDNTFSGLFAASSTLVASASQDNVGTRIRYEKP